MVIEVREVHPLNAESPIEETASGTSTEISARHPESMPSGMASSCEEPVPKKTNSTAAQPLKAFLPMLVTPSGTVNDMRALQPENAKSPIVLSPDPKLTMVILEQLL